MIENDENVQQGAPTPEATVAHPKPEKSKGIPKAVWFIGCGCLLLIALAIIVALLIYFGISIFGGKDPIAAVVPNDSMLYMSVDLRETQSDSFNDIVTVFQEIADPDQKETLTESLDTFMDEELNMSFTDDILPWIGQYSAFVITDGDFTTGEIEYLLIVQTRNQGKTDEFVGKLIDELEANQDLSFTEDKKDGITLYTYEAESQWEENTVIARVGKFLYISNSDKAILDSAKLKKSDSLANASSYKNTVAALPKKRLATAYISGKVYEDYFTTIFDELGLGYSTPSLEEIAAVGLDGAAISASVENVGLRFDVAVTYDESKISDFQKESLSATYIAPNADKFVPENTFFFMGVNSSQSPGKFFQEDNPQYTKDVQEALDLLDKEYGISITELLDFFDGEFSLALGPSREGLMAEFGEVNMGLTIFASTNDEAGFKNWFDDLLNVASDELLVEFQVEDAKFGDYALQELVIEDSGTTHSALFYGADNGYIILGTSQDILENGLNSNATLANNATYRDTWKAFSSNSVPYMYLDTLALVDFIKENGDSYTVDDLRTMENGLSKIPVVAVAMNNAPGSTQSMTMFIFIDTGK